MDKPYLSVGEVALLLEEVAQPFVAVRLLGELLQEFVADLLALGPPASADQVVGPVAQLDQLVLPSREVGIGVCVCSRKFLITGKQHVCKLRRTRDTPRAVVDGEGGRPTTRRQPRGSVGGSASPWSF